LASLSIVGSPCITRHRHCWLDGSVVCLWHFFSCTFHCIAWHQNPTLPANLFIFQLGIQLLFHALESCSFSSHSVNEPPCMALFVIFCHLQASRTSFFDLRDRHRRYYVRYAPSTCIQNIVLSFPPPVLPHTPPPWGVRYRPNSSAIIKPRSTLIKMILCRPILRMLSLASSSPRPTRASNVARASQSVRSGWSISCLLSQIDGDRHRYVIEDGCGARRRRRRQGRYS
jgi:hypothetical protein